MAESACAGAIVSDINPCVQTVPLTAWSLKYREESILEALLPQEITRNRRWARTEMRPASMERRSSHASMQSHFLPRFSEFHHDDCRVPSLMDVTPNHQLVPPSPHEDC